MVVLNHLEPQRVFHFFEELCAIPHGSGNTKAVSDWLVDFAKARGLRYVQDQLNNVVIFQDAAPGYESAEPVILQGHMDMVCEKEPGCTKDMAVEGLDLVLEGDTVSAKGTTLGGDDGSAVAMALAILDVNLPDGSGFDLCREVKEKYPNLPVLFFTANDLEEDVLKEFDLGADDYITKPFLPQELLLRLAAVLRRVYGAGAGEVLRLGAAEVHWGTGTVRRPGGGEAALTAKEYALLKKLAANRGNIVTIDALCQALWEGPMVGYENTLMVHIRRLREKLETDPSHPQYLLTVRGLGYRLAQEERP